MLLRKNHLFTHKLYALTPSKEKNIAVEYECAQDLLMGVIHPEGPVSLSEARKISAINLVLQISCREGAWEDLISRIKML